IIWLAVKRSLRIRSAKIMLLLLSLLMLSILISRAGPCDDGVAKAAVTMPGMVALVLVGCEVGFRAANTEWLKLQQTALACLFLAYAAFFVEMAMPAWFPDKEPYRRVGRYSGLFQEPSEAAFTLFPCIAVLLVAENKKMRWAGRIALVGLLALSRSSTLIALFAAWILYRVVVGRRIGTGALVAVASVALVALAAVINYDSWVQPTASRVAGIFQADKTTGLSSLVYLQGWQDMWANLTRTHGLGLGFNMMGCHPLPDVSSRELLSVGGFGELNADDGSFPFSKTVSEFGIVGIAFYCGVVWWWLQLEKRIRREKPVADPAAIIQAALIFCFVTSSFIRG